MCERSFSRHQGLVRHNLEQHPISKTLSKDEHSNENEQTTSPPSKQRRQRKAYKWRPSTTRLENLPEPDELEVPSASQLSAEGYDEPTIKLIQENQGRVWTMMKTTYRTSSKYLHSFNVRLSPREGADNITEIKRIFRVLHRRAQFQYKVSLLK